MQEPQPLGRQLLSKKIDAGRVAARPGKAGDQTQLDRVFADAEDDWDRRGRSFGRWRSKVAARRGDNGDATADEVGHERRQAIELAVQPVVLDRHVLALDVAGFIEALAERGAEIARSASATCRGRIRSPASPAAARAPRAAMPPPRRRAA